MRSRTGLDNCAVIEEMPSKPSIGFDAVRDNWTEVLLILGLRLPDSGFYRDDVQGLERIQLSNPAVEPSFLVSDRDSDKVRRKPPTGARLFIRLRQRSMAASQWTNLLTGTVQIRPRQAR